MKDNVLRIHTHYISGHVRVRGPVEVHFVIYRFACVPSDSCARARGPVEVPDRMLAVAMGLLFPRARARGPVEVTTSCEEKRRREAKEIGIPARARGPAGSLGYAILEFICHGDSFRARARAAPLKFLPCQTQFDPVVAVISARACARPR